jgi:hypothetical protein
MEMIRSDTLPNSVYNAKGMVDFCMEYIKHPSPSPAGTWSCNGCYIYGGYNDGAAKHEDTDVQGWATVDEVKEQVQLTLHRTQLIRPDIIASSGRARSALWHGVTPRHGAPFRRSSGEDADVAAAIALSGMVDRPGERPDPNLYRTLSDHSLAAEAPPGPPAAPGPAARAAAGGLERPPSDHSLDLLAVPGLAADRRSRSREDLARGALYLPRSPVTAPLFRSRSDESLLARLSRYDTPPPDEDEDEDDDGPGYPL